jgi:hypothetical protein
MIDRLVVRVATGSWFSQFQLHLPNGDSCKQKLVLPV